jgi:tRNA (guanine-N7-)-methyltransferase
MARKFDLSKPDLTKKLARFAEVGELSNCVQVNHGFNLQDFELKGKWSSDHFGNSNPLTLELACGKGEYSVGQGRMTSDQNFLGVDLKGNRLWKGAKIALEDGLTNVGFLRTHIDHIDNLFAKDEVDKIWIIFPDPQAAKERKRLTSPLFLDRYRKILKASGTVNLKTDDRPLYDYTIEVCEEQGLEILGTSTDLYPDLEAGTNPYLMEREDILRIRTFYEEMWLEEGRKINYVSFRL